MRSHDIDARILGNDMQLVEIELDPGETVIAEAGAMSYMEDGIVFEARMGDGTEARGALFDRLLQVGSRVLTGESLFMTHFTNRGAGKRRVAFSAPYPGQIVSVDLSAVGGELICQRDAFLAAAFGTKVGIAFQRRLGAGFFGGEGFILERLSGDGKAFVHAGGTVVRRELRGETLRVDTGCVVAYTGGIDFDIERAGSLKSMFLGGEGLFLATLRGTGTVYLQSLPFGRMADRIVAASRQGGGQNAEEGSILSSLFRMFGGDD